MFLGITALLLLVSLAGALFVFLFMLYRSEGVSKVKMIEDALPGDNCGKCGYASCQNFAATLTKNQEKIVEKCSLMNAKEQQHVRNLLGYYAKDRINETSNTVAYIACKERGRNLPARIEIMKNLTCSGVVDLVGNNFACHASCLGLGECIAWCPRNAIYRNKDGVISIDHQKCSGCGVCVARCPNHVIKLIPREANIVVTCNSHDTAEVKEQNCPSGGCNGCGLCHTIGGSDNFTIDNVLAKRGSGTLSKEQMRQVIARCPTNVIHSIDSSMVYDPLPTK